MPVPRSVLLSILAMGLVCPNCMAQQPESAGQLPDAPSATVQGQSGEHGASQSDTSIDLLERRSRVFPNLAMNTAPLTAGQKFGLFARNSISIVTIVGAAASAGINQARDTQTGYGGGGRLLQAVWGVDGLRGVEQLLWNVPAAIPFAPGPALLRAGHREFWR